MAVFLLLSVLVLVALVLVTSWLGQRVAREEALTDAQATTGLLARSVAQPSLTRGVLAGDAGAVDRFDRTMLARLDVDGVRRVKIWDRDGSVVWSDEARLTGERFELDEEELEVLERGGSDAEISDLSEPENRYEPRDGGGLVEVYTRIEAPDGTPLLFEAYFADDQIDRRQAEVVAPFRAITLGALVAVLLVATPMIWVLTRRLTRAADERERLLVAAAEASDAERRRIARDLHDGVVQDLAGTSFALSALAGRETDPDARGRLDDAAGSVRSAMRALRSLLVEIHPPGLRADGLPAALQDLTAGAADQGVEARVEVETRDLDALSDDGTALVWRVAQEAVRNALRHAGATTLVLELRGRPVTLTVRDDGVGFDPAAVGGASYGLRGLTSLARDHGGRLEVDAAPGRGTTVRLEVAP